MKNADYTELKKSEKFTPALYHEKDGIWEGGSTSQFSPVMTFKLWEKFSDSCLEVSESIEVNGKKTFGCDEPIIAITSSLPYLIPTGLEAGTPRQEAVPKRQKFSRIENLRPRDDSRSCEQ